MRRGGGSGSPGTRIRVISTDGIELVGGLDEATRSLLGRYHNAVRRYLRGGDDSGLDEFVGVTIGGRELETRTAALDWWGLTGELAYESIYGEMT